MLLLRARRTEATVVPAPDVAIPVGAELAPPDWRRLVLVLVDRFDLRASRPMEHAWRVPAHERRALHVATDPEGVWSLADTWMTRRPSIPLHMVESDGGVASTVRRVVEFELASGYDEVVVLVGRLSVRSRLRRLLHDRSADRISAVLSGLPGVTTAVMTVAVV